MFTTMRSILIGESRTIITKIVRRQFPWKCLIVFPSSFQTNNRQVVSGAANGGVRVWDVISGECLQHLRGHVKSVTAVACTAEHLLSVSLESVLCIWDRSRGECLHRLKQVSSFYFALLFSLAQTLPTACSMHVITVIEKNENCRHCKATLRDWLWNLAPHPPPIRNKSEANFHFHAISRA